MFAVPKRGNAATDECTNGRWWRKISRDHGAGGVVDHTHTLLEDKMVAKFGGWKMNLLSHPGRLVLLKSVSAAVTVYYMSTSSLPWRTINRLTSLMRKFYWGKLQKDWYIAYISWDKMCKPVDEGGLNIWNLRRINDTLLLKLTWQFAVGRDRLWVHIMKAKYCSQKDFWEEK
jgi:hypothetical protein